MSDPPFFALSTTITGHNGSFSHDSMVEHRCTHPYQGAIVYLTPVQGDGMAYGDVVAQDNGGLAVQGMQTGAILDVGAVANLDVMHIAAQNDARPDGHVVAQRHIADDDGTICQITMFSELGLQALDYFYDCHI